MSLSRAEKAGAITIGPSKAWFKHNPAPNKPTAPSTSSLTANELTQFNLWLQQRLYGSLGGQEQASLYPNVQAMIATYEAYIATPAYQAWANNDNIQREAQWRLAHVDAIATTDTAGTVPPGLDPTGVGVAAPATFSPGNPSPTSACSVANFAASSTTSMADLDAGPNTVTVPSSPANSGMLRLAISIGGIAGTSVMRYKIASGSFTAFTTGQVITLTNGQALTLELHGATTNSTMTGGIYDNDTGALIATVNITITVAAVTIGAAWTPTTCSNAGVCDCTSSNQTLTVPSGNPGVLKFSVDDVSNLSAMKYSTNAGSTFTTVANNGTVTFSNGNTLELKAVGIPAGPTFATITVTDVATGAVVGTFQGENTHT